jgi:hypothetical protein
VTGIPFYSLDLPQNRQGQGRFASVRVITGFAAQALLKIAGAGLKRPPQDPKLFPIEFEQHRMPFRFRIAGGQEWYSQPADTASNGEAARGPVERLSGAITHLRNSEAQIRSGLVLARDPSAERQAVLRPLTWALKGSFGFPTS